jgi:hypothetical protein
VLRKRSVEPAMSETWEGIHRLVIVAERPSTRGKEERIDNDTVLQRVVLTTTCMRTSDSRSTVLPVGKALRNTVEL